MKNGSRARVEILICGFAFAASAGARPEATGPDKARTINKEATIAASTKDVWRAWTTTEGITSFFGAAADIELSVGGKFEVYFALDAPQGSRGSEGCKVLAYLPHKMLAFSWNAPPSIPALRDAGAQTQVVLEFTSDKSGATHVALTQHGLGQGKDWDKYHAYFDRAWTNVLASLKKQFAPSGDAAKAADPPSATQYWVYFIRPARDDFFEKPSEADRELLQAHVAHIKKLLSDGKLILAGPCEDPAYYPQSSSDSIKLEMPTPGIVVFQARDADDARRIMEADPAVKAGVFKARVNRFHLAFERD